MGSVSQMQDWFSANAGSFAVSSQLWAGRALNGRTCLDEVAHFWAFAALPQPLPRVLESYFLATTGAMSLNCEWPSALWQGTPLARPPGYAALAPTRDVFGACSHAAPPDLPTSPYGHIHDTTVELAPTSNSICTPATSAPTAHRPRMGQEPSKSALHTYRVGWHAWPHRLHCHRLRTQQADTESLCTILNGI